MGQAISAVFDKIANNFGQRESRILMLGLDAAGKTTILYKLKLNETVTTIPTLGFNVEQVKYKNITMKVWDIGGQDKIRPLWRCYFANTDALVYVVDSADSDRIVESMEELNACLNEPELARCPVLIYANKQDMRSAEPVASLEKRFASLSGMGPQRKWFMQPAVATTGEGLHEGLEWLAATMKNVNNSSKKK